jgi:2-oxo-4-hydroxy-4-carboxy-5-ureidoimidazoline decarboxylase
VIDTRTPDARERLEAVLGVRRLVDEVAGGGPYPDVEALAAAMDAAAARLTDAELDEAAGAHPRIGAPAAPGSLSAGEQAGLGPRDEGADAAIARGNAVYEGRFGRIFLIRAAGRSRQDVLDELQRRLKNDPAEEAEEAKVQLREIIGMRLRDVFGAQR